MVWYGFFLHTAYLYVKAAACVIEIKMIVWKIETKWFNFGKLKVSFNVSASRETLRREINNLSKYSNMFLNIAHLVFPHSGC